MPMLIVLLVSCTVTTRPWTSRDVHGLVVTVQDTNKTIQKLFPAFLALSFHALFRFKVFVLSSVSSCHCPCTYHVSRYKPSEEKRVRKRTWKAEPPVSHAQQTSNFLKRSKRFTNAFQIIFNSVLREISSVKSLSEYHSPWRWSCVPRVLYRRGILYFSVQLLLC